MDAGDVSYEGENPPADSNAEGHIYTFSETVQIGADYVYAYNQGLNFTMNSPVIVVDTSDQVQPGFFSSFGFKLGLGIGGGVLVIALIIGAILVLKRR